MIDLDELERLVAQMAPGPWVAPRVDVSTPAQGTPAPYALSITGQGPRMFTVDRCRYMHADDAAGIAALRNAAEELIRDARRWREMSVRLTRNKHGVCKVVVMHNGAHQGVALEESGDLLDVTVVGWNAEESK